MGFSVISSIIEGVIVFGNGPGVRTALAVLLPRPGRKRILFSLSDRDRSASYRGSV